MLAAIKSWIGRRAQRGGGAKGRAGSCQRCERHKRGWSHSRRDEHIEQPLGCRASDVLARRRSSGILDCSGRNAPWSVRKKQRPSRVPEWDNRSAVRSPGGVTVPHSKASCPNTREAGWTGDPDHPRLDPARTISP